MGDREFTVFGDLKESVAIVRVCIHVESVMVDIKQWHLLSQVSSLNWNQMNPIQLCSILVLVWPHLVCDE